MVFVFFGFCFCLLLLFSSSGEVQGNPSLLAFDSETDPIDRSETGA